MKTLTLTRGISADGNTLYKTDATEGYGTDLPARNTLALVPYITYKRSDAELEVIAPATYSPLDVVTFSINVDGKDGVYYAKVFALPRWTSGPLDEGDVVWDVNTGLPSKMISGTVTAIEVSSLINEDVDYGEINSLVRVELTKYKDQLLLIMLEKKEAYLENACEHNEYEKAKSDFEYIEMLIAGAHIKFCTGVPLSAQLMIETGISFAEKALDIN